MPQSFLPLLKKNFDSCYLRKPWLVHNTSHASPSIPCVCPVRCGKSSCLCLSEREDCKSLIMQPTWNEVSLKQIHLRSCQTTMSESKLWAGCQSRAHMEQLVKVYFKLLFSTSIIITISQSAQGKYWTWLGSVWLTADINLYKQEKLYLVVKKIRLKHPWSS